MNSIFIITFFCYNHYVNSLSLEFTATESPNGILELGNTKVSAICDPTRECKLGSQSRGQCDRLGCCWHQPSKKCVSKKYFILDSVAPKIATYKLVTEELRWDEANDYCSDNFGGSLVMTGVDTNQGRVDLCSKVNCDTNAWIGLRDIGNKNDWVYVDGTPVPSDFEYAWYYTYNGGDEEHMLLNCAPDYGLYLRGNIMDVYNSAFKFICQY